MDESPTLLAARLHREALDAQRRQVLVWMAADCHEAFPCDLCSLLIDRGVYDSFAEVNWEAHYG